MHLADFLLQDTEAILAEWEAFAAEQLPAAARMESPALRDHAEEMLRAMALDLRTAQTAAAQLAKSRGHAPSISHTAQTAAQAHAVLRARCGFDINQLAAEYRALRASVLRLWVAACRPSAPDMEELVRFNEAVDQALAESIASHSAAMALARNLLLGTLGHDMRGPLQAILMTAHHLAKLDAGDRVSDAAKRLIDSSRRIKALLDDLMDLGRSQLGLGISIRRSDVDLVTVIGSEVDLVRAAYPERTIAFDAAGRVPGSWDPLRLQQLADNLIINALKYGSQEAPVRVSVHNGGDAAVLEVANVGTPIGAEMLLSMFDPLVRGAQAEDASSHDGGLGLGLFIVRQIARAHGGEVSAESVATDTVFRVRLPLRAAVEAAS